MRGRRWLLFLATPADGGLGVVEDVVGGRMAHGPVGIGHAVHWLVAGFIANAQVPRAVEVGEHPVSVLK